MSARVRSALVIMAIAFAFTMASFVLSISFTRMNIQGTTEQDLALALALADNLVSTKINLLKSDASTIAERLLKAESVAEMSEIMSSQIGGFADFRSLTVLDRGGVAANYGQPPCSAIQLEESAYLQQAFDGKVNISSTHYDGENGNFVIHVFVPMGPDRVLSATISGTLFSDLLAGYKLWQTGRIFMVDEHGYFLARYDQDSVLKRHNFIRDAETTSDVDVQRSGEFIRAVISGDYGSGYYHLGGQKRIGVYKRVTGSEGGWRIGVAAPVDESPMSAIQSGLIWASLVFFAAGAVVAVLVSGFVARPFQRIKIQNRHLEELSATVQAQAAQILGEHERTKLLLDATPLSANLWDRNFAMFECNEEVVKLFGLKDKQEFIKRFLDLSPKYQLDGKCSHEKTIEILKKVFAEGRHVFEWMHQRLDGTPIPVEVTMVRVKYGDDYAVAGYARDLREHKKMMHEIEHRDHLLSATNQVAGILLQSEQASFEGDLSRCMGLMGEAVGADRVSMWRNSATGERLYCSRIYKWANEAGAQASSEGTVDISYDEKLPGWKEILSQGEYIHSQVSGMSAAEQVQLSLQGVLSLFVVPIFVRDQFWGFMGYDNCRTERIFGDTERSILLSGSLMIANALQRHEMMQSTHDANQAKSVFLASVSHEMRTPLNAIIGLSEMSLEAGGLSEDDYLNLENINNAGMTLLGTVNDILDISKIEAGKSELVPVEYDIPSLINDAVTQSVLYIDEKPIRFILDVDANLPAKLYGDELRVKQVFNNILSNAFKYTEKGEVEFGVHCEQDGDTVWMTVSVRDTGIGINRENVEKLFDDYMQVHRRTNRQIIGTGLGLPITKKVVEMMDGSISVESEYGKGSVFTVRLPQGFVSDAVIGSEVAGNLKGFRYSDQKRKLEPRRERFRLPYARVLVVDDVMINLDVARGFMKPYGMQIDCVSSGMQAIEVIREGSVRYNAVFMDHMMPEMDGVEAVRIIREEIGTEYARTVPIIALTANAIAGNEEMFLSKGFQAFLTKPLEISRLDAVIRQWVQDEEQEKRFSGQQDEDVQNVQEVRPVFKRKVEIAGLDMDEGIRRIGGDELAYLDILRSFAANTPMLLEKISGVGSADLAGYGIIVHGIKGSARSICAQVVGDMASALEVAAMSGDYDFVVSHNGPFLEVARLLVSDIEGMLAQMGTDSLKVQKAAPDKDVLNRILEACRHFDMDTVDAAIRELESFEYEADGELVSWLWENVQQFNIDQIIERLSALPNEPKT